MRASQPLCSEAAGRWPNSECHSKNARGNEAGKVHDLERLVMDPASSPFVRDAALFEQVERRDGGEKTGRVCKVDVTHLKSEQTDVCDTAALALRFDRTLNWARERVSVNVFSACLMSCRAII